jgi:NitT/TauT family transport system ATP-binding protein
MQLLELLGLTIHADKLIWQLSGGEQSRVAIARALVASPQVLLMDEPFASLDAITREELQVELRNLHDQLGLTTVFVTHDIQEAIYLGDRVHVVDDGHLVHTQDIDFQISRQLSLKDEANFANYSHILRTKLGSKDSANAPTTSTQRGTHV